MHDNEDSSDNRPINLKWGTQKANLNYPGFIAPIASAELAITALM